MSEWDRNKYQKDKWPSLTKTSCPICEKTFARPYTMKEHLYGVHLKERKYKCVFKNCSFRTNRTGNYHLHFKKVHNIQLPLLSCYAKGCGKKMRSETNLIKHMKVCKHKPIFTFLKCPHPDCDHISLTTQLLTIHNISYHDSKEPPLQKINLNAERRMNEIDDLLN